MFKSAVRPFALLMSFTLTSAIASPATLGAASARGRIRIDGSLVNGNATLFDGSVIETEKATTYLRLNKAVELKLAVDSRGRVFQDRFVLERGASQFGAGKFVMEAKTLRITPEEAHAKGVVSLTAADRVEVSALTGRLRVATQEGTLIAVVRPGRLMAFSTQTAGATAVITVTGPFTKANGKYFITDAKTGVTFEVRGLGLEELVGKKVEITGTPDPTAVAAGNAAAVLFVTSSKVVSAAPVATAGTGMAQRTKLIIAGVAVVAATGAGLGIYEANQGESPASR